MSAEARQEDFVFAEHVLRRGFATEDQVQECLGLLERMRAEMNLEETLENILLKRGYLALAQAQVIRADINPEEAGRAKNQIEGYQLLVRLGSGAMGSVYKAHHQKLDIPVALKVLRIDLAKSKTQIERLKREAQLAARLNHINIVRSLDVGESNGFHYFAMEFVDGKTVRQYLHRGRMREKEALRIVRDVARALDHAHTHGVIHRDVKPANIILTRAGVVKLADFGLARGKEPSDLTLDQASIGTPQYLAPEQARRGADATPRSDLFSLGASIYHMVTGRPPFSGENLGEIFQKVLACEFDPPEGVVQDLSIDTVYLIHRLMRAHPRERYASAADLLADLDRLEAGHRIAPAGFKGDYQKFLVRRRTRQGLVAAGSIAIIALASLFIAKVVTDHREETERLELCRAANEVGKQDLLRVNDLDELDRLHEKLLSVRPSQCKPDEIADLAARITAVGKDRNQLQELVKLQKQAEDEEAPFRSLFDAAEAGRRKMQLPGPRLRGEKIRDAIGEASAAAARARCEWIYNKNTQESRDAAVASLQEFERELRERFLPVELDSDVKAHAFAFKSLIEAWEQAEDENAAGYRTALAKHQYREARRWLNALIAAKAKALQRARGLGITEGNFLHWFNPDRDDPRALGLTQAEDDYYTTIDKKVRGYLERNDPDAAQKLVGEFEANADTTYHQVKALLGSIEQHRHSVARKQDLAIETLNGLVRRALADRQYGRAFRLVSDAYQRPDWMPAKRSALKEMFEQARMYEALLDRYQKNAAKAGIEPAAGDDPDLFRNSDGLAITLKDLTTAELQSTLGFREPEDVKLRGYFHLIESYYYSVIDPRIERKQVSEAILYLNRSGDPMVRQLTERETALKQTCIERENRARLLHSLAKEAEAKKGDEDEKAFQYVRTLLSEQGERLRMTDYVDTNWPEIRQLYLRLDRRQGAISNRIEAGLPEDNFAYDAESGRARYTFDFREWWPDEKHYADTPEERERMRERLDDLAWKFWREQFKGGPAKEEQWRARFVRAKHQLRLFNARLVPDRKLGGARFDPGKDRRSNLVIRGAPQGELQELKEITLANRLRADADWSLELTVSWDVDIDGKKLEPRELEDGRVDKGELTPGFFMLAAGQIQACVLAAPRGSGGGLGARILRGTDPLGNFDKLFEDFHWRTIHNKKRLKRLPTDRSHFMQYEAGVPYRMRLERKGALFLFSATTQDDWKKTKFRGKAVLRMQMNVDAQHAEADVHVTRNKDTRVFRIFSLNPCRLHEVVMSGVIASE